MTNMPPLPDMIDVLGQSKQIDEVAGLRDWSRRWLIWGEGARERVSVEASALARPSIRPSSLAAVGRTGARAMRAAAPGLADDAKRRAKDGPLEKGAAIKHVQEVVKAGGSTFVKLGQFVATAQGLLPDEWVDAFGWCRDTVPALPPGMAEQIFEDTFQVPVDSMFASFDPEPLGSASIGQVHAATMPDGREVVVKVRRPGLRQQFASDLRAMALAAAAAERASKTARTANLTGFVELFAQLVLEEVDFRFEALNQVEMAIASEAAGHDYVTFPRPIPHLATEDVLVMTRVPGVRYTDAMLAYPDVVDGERLLNLALTLTLEHTLAYGLFHGDLHAGNVLVDEKGNIGLLDFGIAGRVDSMQRAALVRFLIGFAQNNFPLMMRGMQDFGAIPMGSNLVGLGNDFEARVNAVNPALLTRDTPMTVDDLGVALGIVIRFLVQNQFRLPKELVLFMKNLLYLNGFCVALAPDTDLFSQIEPIFTYFFTKYPAEMGAILSDI